MWLLIFRDAKQHTLLKNILKHEWSLGQCDGSASKGAVAGSDDLSLVLWDVRGRKGRSDSLKVREFLELQVHAVAHATPLSVNTHTL